MPKVNSLESFRAVNKDFWAEIDAVMTKYGMTPGKKRGTFGPSNATFKIDVTFGVGEDLEATRKAEWVRVARLYQLPEDAYGKYFRQAGHTWKIKGIDTKRRRSNNVVIVERQAGGKSFVMSPDMVRYGLSTGEIN